MVENNEWSKSINEDELLKRYQVEIYDAEKLSWEDIKKSIIGIEVSAFGKKAAFDEEMLRDGFEDPESTVVLVRDKSTNKIVGFSCAQPTKKVYTGGIYPERTPASDTAYISDTAFKRSCQGKGLVGELMKRLEVELVRKGFSFVERDAANHMVGESADDQTYADKIRKSYQGRVIIEEAHDSEHGPQVFFRIRL